MKKILCLIFVSLVVALIFPSHTLADNISWFNTPTSKYELKKLESDTSYPKQFGSVDCTLLPTHNVAYYPAGLKQFHPTSDDCADVADFGYISSYGVMLAGTSTSYPVMGAAGGLSKNFMRIPGTDDLIYYDTNLYIFRDFPNNFSPLKDPKGHTTNFYQLSSDPYAATNLIHFEDGTPARQGLSYSFTNDGRFMTYDLGQYQALVDLNSLTAYKFGKKSTDIYGGGPQMSMAINSNAQVVMTVDPLNYSYRIYDMNSCISGIDNTKPKNCNYLDLYNYFSQNIPNFRTVNKATFRADGIIELYVMTNDGKNHLDKYQLSLPGAEVPRMSYMALGDSFASGEGARNYKLMTDTKDNHCHLSNVSYPYLIKSILSWTDAESIACSGAHMRDVVTTNLKDYNDQNKGGPQANGKKDALYNDEIKNNFLPGYRGQLVFIQEYQPQNITLSIGGNDVGFSNIIQRCMWPDTCYSRPEERAALEKTIKEQFIPLTTTYQSIITADPGVRLYVIGYPELVDPSGDCALNVHLDHDELMFAQKMVHDLDHVIEKAADSAGAYYVDVSQALYGHRMCENDSWDVAVNGLTAGDDNGVGPVRLIGNESYHPNQLGHILLSKAILSQTSQLSAVPPAANQNITVDNMPSELNPNNVPYNDFLYYTDQITDSPILKYGMPISTSLDLSQFLVEKGANFLVSLHSTPTTIGTAAATSSTSLQITASIPSDIPPGPHEIHITGADINGQPIDLYQPITVVVSDNDWDGDGISNSADRCVFITPSEQDSDGDGIDDACDDFIGSTTVNNTDLNTISDNNHSGLQFAAAHGGVNDPQNPIPTKGFAVQTDQNSSLQANKTKLQSADRPDMVNHSNPKTEAVIFGSIKLKILLAPLLLALLGVMVYWFYHRQQERSV